MAIDFVRIGFILGARIAWVHKHVAAHKCPYPITCCYGTGILKYVEFSVLLQPSGAPIQPLVFLKFSAFRSFPYQQYSIILVCLFPPINFILFQGLGIKSRERFFGIERSWRNLEIYKSKWMMSGALGCKNNADFDWQHCARCVFIYHYVFIICQKLRLYICTHI